MTENLNFENLPTAVSQLSKKLENIERLLLQKNEQQSTEQPDQFLTIQQAADFLNLTVPTLYSKTSKGELPVMKRSKRLYFSRIELMEYLKAGRKKTMAETAGEAELYLTKKKRG
ncbi:MAG TPA: helix-turn-helix domain-containing protein [Bacteroidales bacterium]|nr:helix-turn-helix domain-containing protein [Bacteroidales bacterium]